MVQYWHWNVSRDSRLAFISAQLIIMLANRSQLTCDWTFYVSREHISFPPSPNPISQSWTIAFGESFVLKRFIDWIYMSMNCAARRTIEYRNVQLYVGIQRKEGKRTENALFELEINRLFVALYMHETGILINIRDVNMFLFGTEEMLKRRSEIEITRTCSHSSHLSNRILLLHSSIFSLPLSSL